MNKIDKRLELLKKLQAEMDRRTQVEEEVYRLISNCEFVKANDLLKTLDDEIIKQYSTMSINFLENLILKLDTSEMFPLDDNSVQ